jgi:hypothetical protein
VPNIAAWPFFDGIKAATRLISSAQTMKVSEKPFPASNTMAISPGPEILKSNFLFKAYRMFYDVIADNIVDM